MDEILDFMREVRNYLAEYVINGDIVISEHQLELTEHTFGKYTASALSISAGPKVVQVEPVAYAVFGASGCIEMYRQGRTAQHDRISFLRMRASRTDTTLVWATRSYVGPPVVAQRHRLGGGRTVPQQQRRPDFDTFSKDVLENRLDYLLSMP